MKKEIEAFVNAANEQELEAAWNNLSAEEQRVFEQLMEEDSPEDALAFFAQLYDDAPKEQTSETVSISENEIYFKRKPLTEEQKKHGSYVDENGNLHVKNLSAFWIPELTTTEKVGQFRNPECRQVLDMEIAVLIYIGAVLLLLFGQGLPLEIDFVFGDAHGFAGLLLRGIVIQLGEKCQCIFG